MAIVAVCACACSCGIEPRALREIEQRVAADRVARGRGCADQVLALDLAENITFRDLVDAAKLRWRIERDYEELKQEVGLGHYEGRGWRGFHHHATLCIAAYGFLISERETIPPSGPRSAAWRQRLAVPQGSRPRGAPDPARAPHPKLNRNHAPTTDRRLRTQSRQMPVLCPQQ